jgi:hypothetical protein
MEFKESFFNTILNENEFQNPQIFQQTHIMLRDLLTQKCLQKFLVTNFGYPRACRFRKHQILKIGRRSYLYQLFKNRDFYFINVAKIGKN